MEPTKLQQYWNSLSGRADTAEMRMRYRLGTALPPGIPTWFIALEHRFTTGIAWRTGALLRHDDGQHIGLVTAKPRTGDRRADSARTMACLIPVVARWRPNLTFNRYPGLNITREVPCPCRRGTNENCSTWFDYDTNSASSSAGNSPPSNVPRHIRRSTSPGCYPG